jgi:hypothetical protein
MGWPCQCCGYRSHAEPPGGAARLCEICAWDETDPDGGWSDGPRRGLREAQRELTRTGACDPALAELTRPPRPDEARPSWWASLDDEAEIVRALIEVAFADVGLEGGVSLAEAELIDDYALPARTEHDPPPAGHGVGPRWQELGYDALAAYHWGNFSFQDARGLRYHAPAYMCLALSDPRGAAALESFLFMLELVSSRPHHALYRLLTPAQRHAVARFLAHLAMDPDQRDATVLRALRDRWGEHLEAEHRACIG